MFGRPMLYYILKSAYGLNPGNVVVIVGHGKDMVKQYLHQNFPQVVSADQDQQLGTAHAVRSAARLKDKMGQRVVVLSGDCPLIESKTLKLLVQKMDKTGSSAAILSTILPDPTGYGRIIKDSRGKVLKVVEQKDATAQQKMIKEINTSIYSFNRDKLFCM
ncbi:MAG: sugar phosphate nucleotidyltransferase [Actinomycetota bacterium]|nr:sugar phosphate nucleotidyltransferase [Actinomycetota bacterium]